MSGYRSLHRVAEGDKAKPAAPALSVKFSPCPQSRPKSFSHVPTSSAATTASASAPSAPLRLLTSSGDGLVRAYLLSDKSPGGGGGGESSPDAAAIRMELTEVLLGSDQVYPLPDGPEGLLSLGAPAVDVVRNYAGSDVMAGEEVAAAIELDGTVRVWTRKERVATANGSNGDEGQPPMAAEGAISAVSVRASHEFTIAGAAGTTLSIRPPALGPPRREGHSRGAQAVAVAVGCLDGSVCIVSTGVPLHRRDVVGGGGGSSKPPPVPDAGTVLDRIGAGSALPTSVRWHEPGAASFLPTSDSLAVGRKDGTVDLYASLDGMPYRRSHRIVHHLRPVRALCYASDGGLLIVGCDDGHVTLHDASQRRPAMVASILHAHRGYVLSAAALSDGKRFVTGGSDGCVRVWDASMPHAGAVHAFEEGKGRAMVWDVDASYDGRRLCGGSDDGLVVIYSSEE